VYCEKYAKCLQYCFILFNSESQYVHDFFKQMKCIDDSVTSPYTKTFFSKCLRGN